MIDTGVMRWVKQSAASMSGTGIIGRGATPAALKADRALRNISNDIWSKVAAEIDQDARQGRYFGCYAVPRSTLSGNSGMFSRGLGPSLRRRNFIAMYSKRPGAGDKMYADVAIYWGHRSRKLQDKGYSGYAFDITMLFFAECVAYGLCDNLFVGSSQNSELTKLMGSVREESAASYFSQNFLKMVATYMYKPNTPTVMNFHIPIERDAHSFAENLVTIATGTAAFGPYSTVPVMFKSDGKYHLLSETNAVQKELEYYEDLYNSDPNADACRTSLGIIGQALGLGS